MVMSNNQCFVIPADAGIQRIKDWVSAFAETTFVNCHHSFVVLLSFWLISNLFLWNSLRIKLQVVCWILER